MIKDNLIYFINSDLTRKALRFAFKKHENQFDSSMNPYICHPYTIALQMDDEISTTVALLHDILRRTETTLEELDSLFPKEVVNAVNLLTRPKGQDYMEYIANINTNKYAKKVKIADLMYNTDLTRLLTLGDVDYTQVEKRRKGLKYLLENELVNA